MTLEFAGIDEARITELASKRFLISVCPKVLHQVAFLRRSVVTLIAMVWFHQFVHRTYVVVQVRFHGRLVLALITFEWFDSHVNGLDVANKMAPLVVLLVALW